MSRRSRLLAAGALVAAAGLLVVACPSSDPVLEAGAHSWGTFTVCLVRTSDTCHAAGAACTTASAVRTRQLTLALRADGHGALVSRSGLAPLVGEQTGTTLTATSTASATICGCAATVTETLAARLLPSAADTSCVDADGGQGCTDLDGGTSADGSPAGSAADGGAADDAGTAPDGANALDLDASYYGLLGTVTDSVTAAGAGCTCLPCQVTYQLTGSR